MPMAVVFMMCVALIALCYLKCISDVLNKDVHYGTKIGLNGVISLPGHWGAFISYCVLFMSDG